MVQVAAGPFPRFQRLLNRAASTALVAAGHFRNVDQTIPLIVGRKRLHPLAGFVGKRGKRRKMAKRSRRKGGKRRRKGTAMRKRSARVARQSPKKIADEFDLSTASQNIKNDLSQKIIGGAGTNQQVWNTIVQGVTQHQRIGGRARRTGLWLDVSFNRSLPQVTEADNHYVRVIFARQRSHGQFPDTAAASGTLPAWPAADACFTKEWHREYKLVKDKKVFFGIRRGLIVTADINKRVTFKFKFNYPVTWDEGQSDMDSGRLYMYVVCPDSVPATANDLKITLNNYCNYFVDELG